MKAVFNGETIAEANKDDLIFIEGKWYFPPGSVKKELLSQSDTPYVCYWKGKCTYFDVNVNGNTARDGAFSYGTPPENAIDRVKKAFTNYNAFWNGVDVTE